MYIGLIFVYPCLNQFDFTLMICGGPCYFFEPSLSTIDEVVNITLPLAIASVANVTVVIRVVCQKRRMKQQKMWSKNRRLIVQLLSFVILHNIVWLPLLVTTIMMLYSTTTNIVLMQLSINILPYGIYAVILICPMIMIFSLPETWPAYFRSRLNMGKTTNIVGLTIGR
jgi:hypothetical protein